MKIFYDNREIDSSSKANAHHPHESQPSVKFHLIDRTNPIFDVWRDQRVGKKIILLAIVHGVAVVRIQQCHVDT